MSSSWLMGGDLTSLGQTKPESKGRYSSDRVTYTSTRGTVASPTYKSGSAARTTHRQVIRTRGHPVSLLGRVEFDIGGAWRNSKVSVTGGKFIGAERITPTVPYSNSPITANSGFYYASSEAVAVCNQALTSKEFEESWLELRLPPASDLQMLRDGATAISRVAPTNPLVDLSTSIAELLREGLPSLPGRQARLSSEYLNYQFGIAPLASDIRDLRAVMKRADSLWKQYAENSGKGVRRRYEFPIETTTSSTVGTSVPAGLSVTEGSHDPITGSLVQPGPLWRRTTTRKRTWFSGSFTYYLPSSPIGASIARLDKLYGLRPGVDTLYQLTPWSWLIDYFTNLGDVLENLNTFTTNGMVMPYGYVMSEKTVTTESRLDFQIWSGNGFKKSSISDTVESVSQRRIPATPFGFGILESGLTGKQKSILIALGLSRR
jgi:hypothetical protein